MSNPAIDDTAIENAIEVLRETGRYSVKDNETGDWIA